MEEVRCQVCSITKYSPLNTMFWYQIIKYPNINSLYMHWRFNVE